MFEENTCEIEYSAGWAKKTIEQARNYESDRYSKPARGRRLDRKDKAFAQKLYGMVGRNAHIVDVPCGSGRFFEIFSKSELSEILSEKIAGKENQRILS